MSHLLAVSHRVMLPRTIATRSLKISRPTVTNRLVRPRQCPEVEGITLAKVIHQQEEVRPPLTLDETNNTMMITSEVVEVHAVDVVVAILIVNQIVDLAAVQKKWRLNYDNLARISSLIRTNSVEAEAILMKNSPVLNWPRLQQVGPISRAQGLEVRPGKKARLRQRPPKLPGNNAEHPHQPQVSLPDKTALNNAGRQLRPNRHPWPHLQLQLQCRLPACPQVCRSASLRSQQQLQVNRNIAQLFVYIFCLLLLSLFTSTAWARK